MTPTLNTYDVYDAEWENPNTGRTVHTASDDWCDVCDSEIDYSIGDADGVCKCANHQPS